MLIIMRPAPLGSSPRGSRNLFHRGWKPTPHNMNRARTFLLEVAKERERKWVAAVEEKVSRWSPEYPEKRTKALYRAEIASVKDRLKVVLRVVCDEYKIMNSHLRNRLSVFLLKSFDNIVDIYFWRER